MSYYPDLSLYTHFEDDAKTFNIGWLSEEHPYLRGEPPAEFTELLGAFCRTSARQTRGYHRCDLCSDPTGSPSVPYGEEFVSLGSAEIRVFGSKKQWLIGSENRIYAAPDLVYHYVTDHHYLPPEEFIAAVLGGPLPGSSEYESLAATYEWHEDYKKDYKRHSFNAIRRAHLRKTEGALQAVQLEFSEVNSGDMASIIFYLGTASFGWREQEYIRLLTKLDEKIIDTRGCIFCLVRIELVTGTWQGRNYFEEFGSSRQLTLVYRRSGDGPAETFVGTGRGGDFSLKPSSSPREPTICYKISAIPPGSQRIFARNR